MPGRVLNFLEFSGKYSTGSNEPLSTDDLVNAPSNFEEGFDDSTYDQPQIGPNRPVSGNYEATPPSPGEAGAPAASATQPSNMGAPEEEEEDDEDEDDDSEAEEGEGDEKEEGNPEAGANPKKKVEEGFRLVKGFAQFLNESYMEEPEHETPGEEVKAEAQEATEEVLNDREKEILARYIQSNPEGFTEIVKDELEEAEYGSNPRERDYEALGMDAEEFEARKLIHKIITYTGIGAGLAVLPAAMFISGGIAIALGVTAMVGVATKDAAFWKKGGSHHYRAQRQAEKEWEEERKYGANPWEEEEECCPECGEATISNEYGVSCGCNM
jgi:hypothetical protein